MSEAETDSYLPCIVLRELKQVYMKSGWCLSTPTMQRFQNALAIELAMTLGKQKC